MAGRLVRDAVLAFAIAFSSESFAAELNCNPIKFVVPYPAGASTDVVARLVAERVGPALKQSVVVENRPGATGNVGTIGVVNAKPDGCTLLVNAVVIATFPETFKNLQYDPMKDLVPIAGLGETPTLFVTAASNPSNSVRELIEASKRSSKGLSFSTAGYGLIQHLAVEELAQRTGTNFLFVPYRGGSEAMADLVTGRVDFASLSVSTVASQLASGHLKALAVLDDKRSGLAPDVPTLQEQGLPDLNTVIYFLLFAPARTPTDVVSLLEIEVNKIVSDPGLRAQFHKIGFEPAPNSSRRMTEIMQQTRDAWGPVIKRLNIKLD
jgi:tripartite-type tricarboxylate transporter receptor subunit TctC